MENRSGNMNRNGPFFVVQTQKQRADGTEAMAEQMARLPYVVGYHWFQWADEPPKGRGGDGEDFNMGLVDIKDRPYEELTAAFTRVNENITKLHVAGPRPAGLVRSDKAWEVPASSSSVTIDGRLDDWSCRDSWVPGVAARTPWLPFADFYVTWEPAGLLVGMVYDEFFSGGGEGVVLADRQRIVLTVAAGEGGPAQVTLVGFGDRTGPAPTDPEEDDRPLAMLLPFAGKDNEPPARLAGVMGAQWERSLNRTVEISVPAASFGRTRLFHGDLLSVGISLVMQGESKEAYWPASQISAPPGTWRLATVRLEGQAKR
jgi:hypothetical protein